MSSLTNALHRAWVDSPLHRSINTPLPEYYWIDSSELSDIPPSAHVYLGSIYAGSLLYLLCMYFGALISTWLLYTFGWTMIGLLVVICVPLMLVVHDPSESHLYVAAYALSACILGSHILSLFPFAMIALRARITESASNAFAARVADSRKDMHIISCICQCAVLALSILGGHLMGEDSTLYITVTIIITIIAHALALLYGILVTQVILIPGSAWDRADVEQGWKMASLIHLISLMRAKREIPGEAE